MTSAADFPSSFYGQHCVRGRNEARWRPGQEASLASLLDGAPIMIRRQGNCAPYAPPRYAPDCALIARLLWGD